MPTGIDFPYEPFQPGSPYGQQDNDILRKNRRSIHFKSTDYYQRLMQQYKKGNRNHSSSDLHRKRSKSIVKFSRPKHDGRATSTDSSCRSDVSDDIRSSTKKVSAKRKSKDPMPLVPPDPAPEKKKVYKCKLVDPDAPEESSTNIADEYAEINRNQQAEIDALKRQLEEYKEAQSEYLSQAAQALTMPTSHDIRDTATSPFPNVLLDYATQDVSRTGTCGRQCGRCPKKLIKDARDTLDTCRAVKEAWQLSRDITARDPVATPRPCPRTNSAAARKQCAGGGADAGEGPVDKSAPCTTSKFLREELEASRAAATPTRTQFFRSGAVRGVPEPGTPGTPSTPGLGDNWDRQ